MDDILIQAKRYAEQAKAYCEQTQCYITEIKELLAQVQDQRARLDEAIQEHANGLTELDAIRKDVGGISAHMGEKYLELLARLSSLKGENTEE